MLRRLRKDEATADPPAVAGTVTTVHRAWLRTLAIAALVCGAGAWLAWEAWAGLRESYFHYARGLATWGELVWPVSVDGFVLALGIFVLCASTVLAFGAGREAVRMSSDGLTASVYTPFGSRRTRSISWKHVTEIIHEPRRLLSKRPEAVHVRYLRDGGRNFPPNGFDRTQPGPIVDTFSIHGPLEASLNVVAEELEGYRVAASR